MDRRQALKQLTVLSGGCLSFSTMAALLDGKQASILGQDYFPQTLSRKQNQLVIQLTERIIPATDTPGAEAARVNQFIDHILTHWSHDNERVTFLEGLVRLDERCQKLYGCDFVALNKGQQITILQTIEQEEKDYLVSNPAPESKPFFALLKELTVVGFYTSEIGATQELKLNSMPGYYKGCVPYSDVGRTWSVLNLY